MKYKLTVYVNKRVVDLAKSCGFNLSHICEKALVKATGYESACDLATKILDHKAQIKLLTAVMEDVDAVHEAFDAMLVMYERRHIDAETGHRWGSGAPTQDQDMTWIRAVKAGYGLQGTRDKELYEKLKEALS